VSNLSDHPSSGADRPNIGADPDGAVAEPLADGPPGRFIALLTGLALGGLAGVFWRELFALAAHVAGLGRLA
jgi:hypothetical protein